jgi:hypothetical protein
MNWLVGAVIVAMLLCGAAGLGLTLGLLLASIRGHDIERVPDPL